MRIPDLPLHIDPVVLAQPVLEERGAVQVPVEQWVIRRRQETVDVPVPVVDAVVDRILGPRCM